MNNKFKLQNYTTTINYRKSVMEIEEMLNFFGATHIIKEYFSDGRIASISFKVGNMLFKLPNNSDGIYSYLFKGKRNSGRINCEKNRRENSDNIAWRILRDWTHSQLTMIVSKQAEPDQLFMPFYMTKPNRTLYMDFKDNILKLENKQDATGR